MAKPTRLTKAEAMTHWRSLEMNGPVRLQAVPYKAEGSRYGYDGIRIDGSRQFIDSVLVRLKDVIEQEDMNTRLELNYTEIADRESGEPTGNWCCYVRVHERGGEAKHLNAVFGRAIS